MKDILDFLFKVGIAPLVYTAGIITIGLFLLSMTKEYAFISKTAVLFLLTH
jgi:hypothetical protein